MPTRMQFFRDLRKEAALLGRDVLVDTRKGKGSHYRVTVGSRTTTVPEKITPLMAKIIRKQLGLD
ncbi:hypothetical protein [Roseibium litorale]|uniref:mRNA interferase HicA n=1 Tax=Roseibium litorale TaxID=2803841 RepID=A0ABR9CNB7_9HYPH|nr:hypothetical protein [Roseibium litorale]MBD8892094.1 hypothetical protein [Roseibium litorale]